jgi:hypothetical protein
VRLLTLLAIPSLLLTTALHAESTIDTVHAPFLRLDLMLPDMPANAGPGASWPTMAQNRSLTSSFCELTSAGVYKAAAGIRNPLAQAGVALGLEACALAAYTYLPFGVTWMHEEYHRAVLSSRGISSYDGLYNFSIDLTSISVSNVSDQALEQLKAQHPADLVRCEEAGYEAQVDLTNTLLKDEMFRGARLIEPMAWYSLFSNSFYLWFNTSGEADEEIAEFNKQETTVAQRDIVGWDFSSWVYDLNKPDQPYDARGIHPSGVGINRYIGWSQLTSQEKSYLRLQAGLSLLNFVRPQLYFANPWRCSLCGQQTDIYAGLQHYLTSFGFAAEAFAIAREQQAGLIATVNIYANSRLTLPGIDVSLLGIPLSFVEPGLTWSPRISLWLQPTAQRYDSPTAQPGMLLSQRLDVTLSRNTGAFTELEAKTNGWSAGTVELGPAVSIRAGATVRF